MESGGAELPDNVTMEDQLPGGEGEESDEETK